MRETKLRGVDLNLLVLLDALLTHGGVSRASAAVNLSQPAMSRALQRLRHLLDDPLLVRVGDRTVPTPRARKLMVPLRAVLSDTAALISPSSFSPEAWAGSVTLAVTDHLAILLGSELMRRVSVLAPRLDVELEAVRSTSMDRLRTGAIHAMVGLVEDPPAELRGEPLYSDRFVTLMRAGHPAEKSALTPEALARLDHVLVTVTGQGPGAVDVMLAKHGLRRRIALRLPNFHAAFPAVAETNLVVTMPRSIAQRLGPEYGLVARETPALGAFTISLLWSRVLESDAAQVWLRGQIRGAAAAAFSDPEQRSTVGSASAQGQGQK